MDNNKDNEDEICIHCKKKGYIVCDFEVGKIICINCGFVYDDRIVIYEDLKRTPEDNETDEDKTNEDYEIDDEKDEITDK